tara:strand:- start:693 stop:968 length:276 start_codon:yes stop_codon:yes gene_type:complete
MRKSRKSIKLTPGIIRKIIAEEKARLKETLEQGKEDSEKVDAEEVDAGEYAGSLEKDLDHLKALKISEAKMMKTLLKIRGKKKNLINKLSK